ncbi:MAG: DUF1638 domain-containing protein [Verrucomicrobiae bacterium]|nr:DUF1638 domain-containing protein [Verrucomicrobiae bacterium]
MLKVIACEIAFREICHLAANSPNLIDLEFLTQGHHDQPALGRRELQQRIDDLPTGRYDAVLIGYGICSSILPGLRAASTPLIIPRAHDCITFFLGSKERYQQCFGDRPGTYYFTSGWLECRARRGQVAASGPMTLLPAHSMAGFQEEYAGWVQKFGREKADYLAEVMGQWTRNYTHATLIEFDFAQGLQLEEQVRAICIKEGWAFERARGDLGMLTRWLAGEWAESEFLRVAPGEQVAMTFEESLIRAEPAAKAGTAPDGQESL